METVEFIFEPSRLFLVWHHTRDDTPKTRRIVGALERDGETVCFKYYKDSNDFKEAIKEGFSQFPAFDVKDSKNKFCDALDVFIRRLPPRSREDFKAYLSQYSLGSNFEGSDFALLAYTGARLSGDNFELCPDLSDLESPADLVIELSGVEYGDIPIDRIQEGDELEFVPEPDNAHDSNAVIVKRHDQKVGYVNKAINCSFLHAAQKGVFTGRVARSGIRNRKPYIRVIANFR